MPESNSCRVFSKVLIPNLICIARFWIASARCNRLRFEWRDYPLESNAEHLYHWKACEVHAQYYRSDGAGMREQAQRTS